MTFGLTHTVEKKQRTGRDISCPVRCFSCLSARYPHHQMLPGLCGPVLFLEGQDGRGVDAAYRGDAQPQLHP